MNAPRRLTDRLALTRNRHQRRRSKAMFLFQAAMHEVSERLKDVNRTFTKVAIVTGHSDLWRAEFPQAKIIPDTDTLDFAGTGYDLVIHAMSLHWADDPVGQIIQCARVLQPDGLFLACLFGGETLIELRQAMAQAETKITGGLSPRIAPMAEIRDLGALLQRAGLALPVADTQQSTASYLDTTHLMHDLRHMGEANSLADRIRTPTPRSVFHQTQKIYAEHFSLPDGRIKATFETVFLTGWAPAADQPKALRPGSATHRLADFLGTPDQKDPKPKD
ncbi:methyltransferase domain-containing protein [Algirhabdus cladophorae]|uniref:methyltransferase domain-containing protein n=1 Tax=Algirhabdus cladophorae TaxID=3377108 RepID=UPI003B849974